MSKLGMEDWVQMATHILKVSREGNVSNMGMEEKVQMRTHPLKAGWGR